MERQAFIDQFVAQLQADGYADPVLVQREPNGRLDDHSHPFEAMALVLQGEMRIHAGGEIKIYRAGDVFHLRRGEPHRETYGPDGVEYLSGRR
jgi:quercetin dioxygenase-like cupin family protein